MLDNDSAVNILLRRNPRNPVLSGRSNQKLCKDWLSYVCGYIALLNYIINQT